ncbi:unnamed protein product, partial [Meganyctiphanes norvegica]
GNTPMWLRMKKKYPYTANLVPHLGVLPRLMALPIAWFYQGFPNFDHQEGSFWNYYPCKNQSISDFFPIKEKNNSLPLSWQDVERIKKNVVTLEKYICQNYSKILEELESDQMISRSIKNMIENFTPSPLNLTLVHEVIQSLKNVSTQMDKVDILKEFITVDNRTLIQEFLDAFNFRGSHISRDQIKNR